MLGLRTIRTYTIQQYRSSVSETRSLYPIAHGKPAQHGTTKKQPHTEIAAESEEKQGHITIKKRG